MATYTDLHNRVKENITVDYNNRITPQEVHLLNQNNIYWGTLNGHVSAENISIKGGTLEGVTLKNTNLIGGINFPDLDGVNFAEIAANVKSLSCGLRDLISLNAEDHRIFAYNDGIYAVSISALSNFVEKLDREKIDSDDVFKEISVISVVFDQKIQNLSDDLSTEINILSNKTFETIDQLSNETIDISSYLNKKINTEIHDRIADDKKLNNTILEEVNRSIARDEELSTLILENSEKHINDINALSNEMFIKIQHDKHYTFEKNSKLTSTYPYGCEDFSINIYKPTVNNGIAKYLDENDDKEYVIGEIFNKQDGNIDFKVYNNIENNAIKSFIILGHTYSFLSTNAYELTSDGYRFKFNTNNNQIEISRCFETFKKISCDGYDIGYIYDFETDHNDNVISGIVTVDTNNPDFKIFNDNFKNTEFNTTNLSSTYKPDKAAEIRYVGNNEFKFIKNIRNIKFSNIKTSSDFVFANIYEEKNINLPDNQINVSLKAYDDVIPNMDIILDANNNYTAIVKDNILSTGIDTDRYYDLYLSADVNNTTATFDLVKVSKLYKYNFGDSAKPTKSGFVVPIQYNKIATETENIDFDEVLIDITNIVDVAKFKQSYVLTKHVGTERVEWKARDIDNNTFLQISLTTNKIEIEVGDKEDTYNESYKYDFKFENAEIYNNNDDDKWYEFIYRSVETNFKEYDNIFIYDLDRSTVGIHSKTSTDDREYDLTISTSENNKLKICIPDSSSADISREFAIVINPQYVENRLVELQLTDKSGEQVNYISNRREQLFKVPTNMWTYLQVNEINHNKFFIKDLDANENAHDVRTLSTAIRKLSNDLSGEIDSLSAALSGEIDYLSAKLSTDLSNEISARLSSFEYLSSQISSNDEDIAEIFARIKGGINYKGVLYAQIPDSNNHIVNINNISNMFVFEQHHYAVNEKYTTDTILSNGYMYIVQKPNINNDDITYKYIIEGKDIEVGDQIIINCKGADGKAIKDLTINDVDIIDNEDYDTVHQPEFIKLSNDLSGEIDSLSAALSGEIDLLSDNISTEVSCLNAKHLAETKYLSSEISSNDIDIGYLSSEISSNDNYIEILSNNVDFLLSAGHDSVEYKGTIPFNSEKIDFNLSAFISPLINDENGFIKKGFMYRLSASENMLSDYMGFSTYLGEKDFFIINKDTTLNSITFNDIDIFRNGETEVSNLSTELQGQISSNDIDIGYLSSEISANDIDIGYLSSEISANDIDIGYLSSEISSNDIDIGYLSSEISANDIDISAISIDLLSINTRYVNTFVASENEHISSDNLILTETEHVESDADQQHKQYKMMFERGTIVLKPLN